MACRPAPAAFRRPRVVCVRRITAMLGVPTGSLRGLLLTSMSVGLLCWQAEARAQQSGNVWKASGKNGAVAAGGQAAADAGIEMLKAGGTAADAAAATTLVMTILE